MEIKEILSKIGKDKTLNELYSSFANSLSKKFDDTDVSDLEAITRFSYMLYISDNVNCAEQLSAQFINYQFDGYNKWTWIEMSIVLYIRINRLNGNLEIVEKFKRKLIEVLEQGNELQQKINKRNLEKFLRGQNLDKSSIELAIKENDNSSELDYRLTYLMQLFKIRELGASEEFTLKDCDNQIDEFMSRIKILIEITNLNFVLPFSEDR